MGIEEIDSNLLLFMAILKVKAAIGSSVSDLRSTFTPPVCVGAPNFF